VRNPVENKGMTEGHDRSVSRAAPILLSMVIPAFNEGARLADGVARLQHAIDDGCIDRSTTEFIVVDDGSSDDTADRARALLGDHPLVQVLSLPANRGKGAAVRAGVAAARGELIAFADADMAIDPSHTPDFVTALSHYDLAIGSRAATGSSVDRPSLQRSAMNRGFNALVNRLTGVSLSDTQCGYKAFRAPVAKVLFHCTVTDRFAFDVEVLALSRQLGLSIGEIPVHWLRVRGSRIRPWPDAVSMARDVLRASRQKTSAPAMPAIGIKLPDETGASRQQPPADLSSVLDPGMPVLERPDGTTLVLCPLVGPDGVEETTRRIEALLPHAGLEHLSVTVTQLCDWAPLSFGARRSSVA
jgi:dolichyl-phosphate beta-glucosyltransferase